jgi:alkylhydroperoxidase/carboxymuconolactone decarboxylase family protein YurZ
VTSHKTEAAHAEFDAVIADQRVVTGLRETAPSSYATASEFWRVPMSATHLSERMKELVLLAMHATSTALNADAIARHVDRALNAGASPDEIVDVLLTITAGANHALYWSVPILEDELAAAGVEEPSPPVPSDILAGIKADFEAARGFWNPDREHLIRLMPEYFATLNAVSTETWKNGPLSTLEREFICIAIDCTVTHQYEPGLRRHIRNAIKHGATRDQILHVFQLAALLGLEGYVLGSRALFPPAAGGRHTDESRHDPRSTRSPVT